MLSIASLKNAINKELAEADSKRQLADSLMTNAQQHESRGDAVRAKLDHDSAQRYLRDLEGIEHIIAGYEAEIAHREQKAREIDKKIDDLNRRFEHDIQQLEGDKGSVVRTLVMGTERQAIQREFKNKAIDNKEQELRRKYQRELDHLQSEKRNILG